jgi:predicted transcriptional regulator
VYSYEKNAPSSPTASNLISIEVDSIALNKIIGDSENVAKLAKKINFRDVNGFVKLINGKSSKFSFFETSGNEVCEAQCDVRCKDTIASTVATSRVPTFTTKSYVRATTSRPSAFPTRSSMGPTYLPPVSITQKDEFVTPPTSFRVTTRRPVTSTQKISTTPRFVSTTRQQTVRPSITSRITVTTPRPTVGRKSTPGPAYLPIARVTTPRQSSWSTEYYPPATWPKTSKVYTERFPTWSPPPNRSTVTKTVTTTPKYFYAEPSNSLAIY